MTNGTQAVHGKLLILLMIQQHNVTTWDANTPFGTQSHKRKSLCIRLICDFKTGQWDTLINKKGSAARPQEAQQRDP